MNQQKSVTLTKDIPIDEGVLSYIESKMYETHSRRDLILYALKMNESIDTDAFKAYQTEYEQCTREFELARDNMDETFIKPVMDKEGITAYTWSADFANGVVHVTYKGDNSI